MDLVHLEPRVLVAQEGSQEAFLLLVARGTLDAAARAEPAVAESGAVAVRAFGPGDVIGESALLERGAWPADYWTRDAVTALRLNREGLEKSLVGNSDPRGFLEVLRGQHNDRGVAASVASLRSRS
jgi:CRP-like cAMP-binding protein